MTWATAKLAAETITLLAVAGSAIFVAAEFHKVAVNLKQTVTGLNGIEKATADTLNALNAPCKDFQGDYICGPIQQLAQTEKNIGILAARSAQQVQQTATLVNAAARNAHRHRQLGQAGGGQARRDG